jgi:uncharacterized membrane protein
MADPITKSIIVKGNIDEVFASWADFESFPKFIEHIKSVTVRDDRISHWVIEGTGGSTIEWDAEITMFEPPRRIGWNSRDSSSVKTSGQVLFTDLNEDETEVTVILKYEPPTGTADEGGQALGKNVDRRLEEGLRNFKKHIEVRTRAGR